MKKKVISVVLLLVVISLLAGCSGKFEMEPDGSLFFEGHNVDRIEFPQEYDGKADSFTDPDRLYGYDFSYEGNLKRFVKYYSWVFDAPYSSRAGSSRVYCKDYCLWFGYGGETRVGMVDGFLTYARFIVYDAEGETKIKCFDTLVGLKNWLD